MSKIAFRLTYDGPALSEHGMDVADLAPALLSLGELIKRANYVVNRDAAKVNLVVQSDFQHACFQINLELFQSLYSTLTSFLDDDNVKTAKDLAEWLGLLCAGGGVLLGLFKYLARRDGRDIERLRLVPQDQTSITSRDDQGVVEIKFKGDNNVVHVNNIVYRLGEDPDVRRDAAKVVAPLSKEGFEELRFDEGPDKPRTVITKKEAAGIQRTYEEIAELDVESYDPQMVTAHLQVSRPDFNPEAKKWRFRYGDKIISVDVSETNIPEQVRARGLVRIGDTWRVKMTITEKRTAAGHYRAEYKVVEVLEFLPATEQATLLPFMVDTEDEEEDTERSGKEEPQGE